MGVQRVRIRESGSESQWTAKGADIFSTIFAQVENVKNRRKVSKLIFDTFRQCSRSTYFPALASSRGDNVHLSNVHFVLRDISALLDPASGS